MTHDVFGTAALRNAVLQAWAGSSTRLREDANTEEDHARGHYRDRVVVELAQNAADAAARAGVPGKLLLRLHRVERSDADTPGARATSLQLVAGNVGAALDAAGVASLASMRASAKQDGHGAVGRFGVGFAAVRSVSDEITVASSSGAVSFSLGRSQGLLADLAERNPAVHEQLATRGDELPILRLPFAAVAAPPDGYDTVVTLALRDATAGAEIRAQLAAVSDTLLLALPQLAEIVIELDEAEPRRLTDVGERWRTVTRTGELDAALLAKRPVEERARSGWQVTWAAPRSAATWQRVVHAPTPTDEPCTLPALLIATFPLDPSRRHVAAGGATDAIIAAAADAYRELVEGIALQEDGDALSLVPVGLPEGRLDGQLHGAAVERLQTAAILVPAGGHEPIAARDATVIAGGAGRDARLLAALGRWYAGLVRVPEQDTAAVRVLGIATTELSDLIDALPTVGEPADWHRLYAALEPYALGSAERESLASLPVQLLDGRVVRGARGLVLPGAPDGVDPHHLEALAPWGVRAVHPDAAHDMLLRLGAVEGTATEVLGLPAVQRAVEAGLDADDDARVAEAVLHLVEAELAAGSGPVAERPWLGRLVLTDEDDVATPATELALPGSLAAAVLDPEIVGVVASGLAERWGAEVLQAVGVRAALAVVTVRDVVAGEQAPDDAALDAIDGWPEYLEALGASCGSGAFIAEIAAVADLDAVRPDAWPRVLGALATDSALRRALLEPVRADTGALPAPSYAEWWLRHLSPEDLGLGPAFAAPGADRAVVALLPPVPAVVAGLDAEVLRALGAVSDLAELDDADWLDVCDDLPSVGTDVEPALALAIWRALARRAAVGGELDPPPERLPAVGAGNRISIVAAEDAAVAPEPMWLQRTDLAAMVPAVDVDAEDLAHLLDITIAEELDPAVEVRGDGDARGPRTVPPAVLSLAPEAPGTWIEHAELTASGTPVEWWVTGGGPAAIVHATTVAGLARGLAQAGGCWESRAVLELALGDPERLGRLAVEAGFERDPEGASS